MAQFPTAAHLVSWAKVSPRTIQSGPRSRSGKVGKGNPYLKRVLGEAATAAAKTDTFLGERYRRLVRRRGKPKALVAVERSILVVVWHLLADPNARFVDLGADFYERRVNKDRRTRDLVRQLMALGHQVTLSPAPDDRDFRPERGSAPHPGLARPRLGIPRDIFASAPCEAPTPWTMANVEVDPVDQQAAPIHAGRILVVDDETYIADLVSMALRYQGFDVVSVATGHAALAAVERARPDLVVLDVMLPDLDGTRRHGDHGADGGRWGGRGA